MTEHAHNSNGRRGRIVSINRSDGGVPKLQVHQAMITESGLEGDRQANSKIHGGPDRAVLVYSWEVIEALAREGHPIGIGTTGENLTVAQLDWNLVVPGVELRVGDARLLVTKMAAPCFEIKGSFTHEDQTRISEKLNPGWSRACTRVVQSGMVRVGDDVIVL
ncbi:MAG: MOSC domain-containing protein [Acidobacteria bacterium]|nr:MOSC domain-containing protein [Acidobacteriota bacterium]